ncbi:hypothetical protein X947_3170 [Burkholderia pseudomallei MSHR7334]|nr:hypothetical protein X947_3170 [Burkholderia pseudomallei MSHR7334]
MLRGDRFERVVGRLPAPHVVRRAEHGRGDDAARRLALGRRAEQVKPARLKPGEMQQRTSEGGSDAEQQPAIADAVGRDLALPVVQRAALLELALDRRIGLIDQRLFAGADDAIGQHERAVMPADARHAAHALVRLRHLHIVRDLRAGNLRHAKLHAHIEQHAAQLRAVASKEAGRHRPPFQDAVAVREFEQVAPLAVHLVARLRNHVDTRADPMRRQWIALIVEAVKPHALIVYDEPRLAVLRAGCFRALGGLRGGWCSLGLAGPRRAGRCERSTHGGGHRIRTEVRSQVVEVGAGCRAVRTEVGHGDDAGDGLGRRAGLRHARIALRRVVVVRAYDYAGVRILAAQCRRDGMQVASVERDGGRIAGRGRERCARGVTLANQQRGRRGRLRAADQREATRLAAVRQIAFLAVRQDELQRPQLAVRVTGRDDERAVACGRADAQAAAIDAQRVDRDALANEIRVIGRRRLGRRPDRFSEGRRGLLLLGQFGQLGRFAGRALGFLPLALRWIDRLRPVRARIEAALFGEVKQRVDGDLAALERLPHITRVLAVVVLRALAPFVPEGESLLVKLGLERHPHLTPRVAVVGRDIAERDSRPLEFGHGCVTHRFPLDARRPASD